MPDFHSFLLKTGHLAFGDGAHPSTQGALAALESMSKLHGVRAVLDMGCGAGILSLKAAYQWHCPVLAVDIESESVAMTQNNANENQLDDLITVVQSDGFSHPIIAARGPYDVILANILAESLMKMAKTLCDHLQEEGVLILSGILRWQSAPLEEAFSRLGLTLLQRYLVQDWVTLVWQRQAVDIP